MRRLLLATSILLFVACAPSEQAIAPSPAGLWVWHQPWESAPPEIVEDLGPRAHAPGALVRFCPTGRFRMATGELYRSDGGIALGASDGLTLYEGTWVVSERKLKVTYRLVDAEIRFTGYDQALTQQIVLYPSVATDRLNLRFRRPHDGREFPMTFGKASLSPDKVDARFVECSGPQPAA